MKQIGNTGTPFVDPTIEVFAGEKSWDAVISFKDVAVPVSKADIVALFLTAFQVIKEHRLNLSADEKEEISTFFL